MTSVSSMAAWMKVVGESPRNQGLSRTSTRSMHPLARHRAAVGRQQEDFLASNARRADHAFADSETHLARGEVRHHDDQPADELFRSVRALDAGEDVATQLAAEAQRQLDQLVGSL